MSQTWAVDILSGARGTHGKILPTTRHRCSAYPSTALGARCGVGAVGTYVIWANDPLPDTGRIAVARPTPAVGAVFSPPLYRRCTTHFPLGCERPTPLGTVNECNGDLATANSIETHTLPNNFQPFYGLRPSDDASGTIVICRMLLEVTTISLATKYCWRPDSGQPRSNLLVCT